MKIEQIPTDKLIPYARNAKKHDAAQVSKLAGSIREFGFTNPVLIDKDNGIIAGHGRVLAAQQLGLVDVPCIRLGHLSDTQRRAYILTDNRLAEIGGGWDLEMLKLELEELDIPLEDIGFSAEDLADLEVDIGGDGAGNKDGEKEEPYSRKIEAPIYTPQGPKPSIKELCNSEKTIKLAQAIQEANLPEDEKAFLIAAAQRHLVFDYGKIAEYYAHSERPVQRFFEDSALVFIDFNKAIQDGYVRLTEEIRNSYITEYGEGEE